MIRVAILATEPAPQDDFFVYYSGVVVPLTLLSAWLLLSKPRPEKKSTIIDIKPATDTIPPSLDSDEYAGAQAKGLIPAMLREFSEISTIRFIGHLLFEWAFIAAAIWLCQRYWHPALFLLAVAWIGARQHALAVLMHDAAHYRAARNRCLNDFLGVLASAPLFISLHAYRHEHFAHHRHVNTNDDPQWVDRDTPQWKFPKTRRALVLMLAGDLLGGGALHTICYSLRLQKRLWEHGTANWRIALQPVLTAAILIAAVGTGNVLLFTLYWIIPIMTWLSMVLRIRSIAEHFALPHDHVLLKTRTVIPSLLEMLFIAPMNIAYHVEHHKYPSVPFHRLGRLHKSLMELQDFRENVHLTRGYRGVFRECLRDANK